MVLSGESGDGNMKCSLSIFLTTQKIRQIVKCRSTPKPQMCVHQLKAAVRGLFLKKDTFLRMVVETCIITHTKVSKIKVCMSVQKQKMWACTDPDEIFVSGLPNSVLIRLCL